MDKLEDEFSKAKNELEHVLTKLNNAKSKLILSNVDISDFSHKIGMDFSALQPKVVQIMKQQQQQQQMSQPAPMWHQQTPPQSKAMWPFSTRHVPTATISKRPPTPPSSTSEQIITTSTESTVTT